VQENCTFPNSMVDRITPVTADADREWLREQPASRTAGPSSPSRSASG
jgi:mannitol 2-dehydrogenase